MNLMNLMEIQLNGKNGGKAIVSSTDFDLVSRYPWDM
jgi:hypothetical protein